MYGKISSNGLDDGSRAVVPTIRDVRYRPKRAFAAILQLSMFSAPLL